MVFNIGDTVRLPGSHGDTFTVQDVNTEAQQVYLRGVGWIAFWYVSPLTTVGTASATLGGTGLKFDSDKAPWTLLMQGCAPALAGVVAVLKFGAKKYAPNSWQQVEGRETRYRDALYRHLHSIEVNGMFAKDPETGLLEWFHVACNALFLATIAALAAKAQAEKETH